MSSDPLADIRARIDKLESYIVPLQTDIAGIKATLDSIKQNYDFSKMMIQWIIAPLVLILGALIGIKIAFPGV